MKRFLLLTAAAVCLILVSGCYVRVGTGPRPDPRPHPRPHHGGGDESVFAEIDAARQLSFDSSRLEVLLAIARRPCLSERARGYLAQSLDMLSFDSSRRKVLMALAENPVCEPAPAREVIIIEPPVAYTDITPEEIDAVTMLGTNESRQKAYCALASQPALSPRSRALLAKAVSNLGTNNARERVLVTLAQNDCPLSRTGVTIAEIEAVTMLGTNEARKNVLVAQARHPFLGPEARKRLVGQISSLGTNEARQQVFEALTQPRPLAVPREQLPPDERLTRQEDHPSTQQNAN